jgi:xanthine dehydrogenase accessory factor
VLVLEFYEKVHELLAGNVPFVSVTIVETIGSVPQNAGSKMLVVSDGLLFGTVGGGKVEKRAIEEAQAFLATASTTEKSLDVQSSNDPDFVIHTVDSRTRFVNWNLNKDIGMTCGGSVKLYFEVFNTHPWSIAVFGAGHCSNALINLLINLDCRVTCFDSRQEWLDRLPVSPKLRKVHAADLPTKVKDLAPNSFVILMTMGHTTDKPILLEILRNWETTSFPYLGVIGSKAKAVRLKQDIKEAELPPEYEDLFYCPMGLSIGNNHPQEIAISIVSQLIEERDKHGCSVGNAQ